MRAGPAPERAIHPDSSGGPSANFLGKSMARSLPPACHRLGIFGTNAALERGRTSRDKARPRPSFTASKNVHTLWGVTPRMAVKASSIRSAVRTVQSTHGADPDPSVGPSADIGFPYEVWSLGRLSATSGCSVLPEDSARKYYAGRVSGHLPKVTQSPGTRGLHWGRRTGHAGARDARAQHPVRGMSVGLELLYT